jgi:hypothetical protein
MVESKIYRGQEVNETVEHNEIDTNQLVYRGVGVNTSYFDLARVRASHMKKKSPLYYRGVVYNIT